MEVLFAHPKLKDIDDIMRIEQAGFTPAEAATKEAMLERIQLINDTFIVARNQQGKVVGYIVGPAFSHRYLTDELYEDLGPNKDTDKFQTVLSLAIAPECRQQGLASQLLNQLVATAKSQQRQAITLTCLAALVPFYEKNGYVNEGLSESAHAGESWYNMVLPLSS